MSGTDNNIPASQLLRVPELAAAAAETPVDTVESAAAPIAAIDPAALTAAVAASMAKAAPPGETAQILASLHDRLTKVEDILTIGGERFDAIEQGIQGLAHLATSAVEIAEAGTSSPSAAALAALRAAPDVAATINGIIDALHEAFAGRVNLPEKLA